MSAQPRIITVRRRERLFYSPPGRRAQAAAVRVHEGGAAGVLRCGGVADLFIVAMLVYDLVTRKRIHPATICG